MKSVKKSVLIWYTPEQMFDLVTDVPRYPEFLPWCDHARIVQPEDDGVTAEVGIAFSGLRQSFTTRNRHTPGRQVTLELVSGPFSQLEGRWDFTPLPGGCRVELSLDYGFDSATLSALVGPVFDKIAGSLVDAFVKRAGQIHG